MLELQKLLVVIEGDSDYQPALEKAAQLAKFAGSELLLVLANYSPYLEDGYYFDPIEATKLRQSHAHEQQQYLEALANPLRDGGLQVTLKTLWGNPPIEEILSYIEEMQPSLVIKATRQHKKLARMFLSNEDWELVRHCPCPLLLVKGKRWEANPVFIAAVDPGHSHDKPAALDHKLLACSKDLANIAGGSVHAFHCRWVPPLSGLYPLMMDAPELSGGLVSLAEQHEIGSSNCHGSTREIEFSLPALCNKLGASAVVMGAVSRSRLDQFFIGNTAEKVLDHLEVDVLVIKPDC